MRLFRLSLLFAVLTSVATSSVFGAARIHAFEPAGATYTQVNGIDLSGTVVGWYLDFQNDGHGFLRDVSGNITTFDVPGASSGYLQGTFAWAINDSGVVVGTYSTASTTFHGFLRDTAGNFTTFDIAGETIGGYSFGPQGMNAEGQIAGIALGSSGVNGFLGVADGTFSVFTPNEGNTQYVGINSHGEATGTYADATVGALHGFSRDSSGNLTTFDVPGAIDTKAGEGTWAYSMNDVGAIAGFWVDANLVGHGYVRLPSGTIKSYDVPAASGFGGGTFINSSGTVTSTWYDSKFVLHGLVRDRVGTLTIFDVPNSSKRPGQGTLTTGINGHGEICGYFAGSKGKWYGFVRTP